MKELFGTLNGHLKRGIVSPAFLLCTVLNTFLMIFYTADYSNPDKYNNLPGLHYFLSRIDSKGTIYLTMMIAAFPAATMFYDDWKSGNFKFIISRAGRTKYTFAVTFAAGITAAAAMFLSYVIFSLYILANFPAVTDLDANALRAATLGFPNSGLLYTGKAFLCYLLYFLARGAMAAFFASAAIFQSITITNKPLTIISPVLIYNIYFCFNFYYFLPALVNPFILFEYGYKLYLVFGGTVDGNLFSPIASIYPMLFSAVFMIILPCVEAKILRVKMNKSL